MLTQIRPRVVAALGIMIVLLAALGQAAPPAEPTAGTSIVHRITAPSDRMELTVHSSRILTLDQKIPQAQVNNPDILELTPLSPTEVQVSAKSAGVTQVTLWGEDKRVFTVDVIVLGDAAELIMHLRTHFPGAALKVVPVNGAVMISGFVEQPEHVERIVALAEQYFPKIINNMTVGGVQQVLLHVKVMEVSRTKLRTMGFDFTQITNGTRMVTSGVSGLLTVDKDGILQHTSAENFSFNIVHGAGSFLGVLEAMRRDNLLKVLAEPTLVTVSGRPAFFNSGGEVPVTSGNGISGTNVDFKKYGTQVDFVPIVLGNGNIHLEVRPRVSEVDPTRAVNGIPGFRVREADTAVEMQAGQTLAIAGLVSNYVESENRGLPFVSDVPYIGALFRRVHEENNEVELLIMVTPELVWALNPDQVPPCGPGSRTTSPSDWELYMKGYLEVPKCCPTGGNCPSCNQGQGQGNAPGMQGGEGMIGDPVAPSLQPTPAAVPPRGANLQNRYNPARPQVRRETSSPPGPDGEPSFFGPVGYDVLN